jgi:hypothetical protein
MPTVRNIKGGDEMSLSDNQVSQAIAAVMGICLHEWINSEDPDEWTTVVCEKCKMESHRLDDLYGVNQFSAFAPGGIWQWKSYMEREMPTVWRMYCENTYFVKENTFIDQIVSSILNPRNLVEYLYDNLDRWGWEECPDKNYGDGICITDSMLDCPVEGGCHGTGKVLTEKARKFKTIVEGE